MTIDRRLDLDTLCPVRNIAPLTGRVKGFQGRFERGLLALAGACPAAIFGASLEARTTVLGTLLRALTDRERLSRNVIERA